MILIKPIPFITISELSSMLNIVSFWSNKSFLLANILSIIKSLLKYVVTLLKLLIHILNRFSISKDVISFVWYVTGLINFFGLILLIKSNSSSLYMVSLRVNPGESMIVISGVSFILIKSNVVFGIKLVVILLLIGFILLHKLFIRVDLPELV